MAKQQKRESKFADNSHKSEDLKKKAHLFLKAARNSTRRFTTRLILVKIYIFRAKKWPVHPWCIKSRFCIWLYLPKKQTAKVIDTPPEILSKVQLKSLGTAPV